MVLIIIVPFEINESVSAFCSGFADFSLLFVLCRFQVISSHSPSFTEHPAIAEHFRSSSIKLVSFNGYSAITLLALPIPLDTGTYVIDTVWYVFVTHASFHKFEHSQLLFCESSLISLLTRYVVISRFDCERRWIYREILCISSLP